MLYVKNVVPAMRATVKTNKPTYIHILRTLFLTIISSGVKNDKIIPPWFGSWLACNSPYSFASSPFDDFALNQSIPLLYRQEGKGNE
jgi:hypothetical protein